MDNLPKLSRSRRMYLEEKACGAPCQRFPHVVKTKKLKKIIANAINVDPWKLHLIGPQERIGNNFVDIGSCMGDCLSWVSYYNTEFLDFFRMNEKQFLGSWTQNSCQVSEKEDMLVKVDEQVWFTLLDTQLF